MNKEQAEKMMLHIQKSMPDVTCTFQQKGKAGIGGSIRITHTRLGLSHNIYSAMQWTEIKGVWGILLEPDDVTSMHIAKSPPLKKRRRRKPTKAG